MINLIELATRIKAARKEKGMTLDALSTRSGVAKGIISKVENFRVTPSLPSIVKIAGALNIPLEKLFEGIGVENDNSSCIVKKSERKEVERDSECSSIRYFDMAPSRSWRKMDPFELSVPAGGGRTEPMHHEGEEFLTVLEGNIDFQLGEEKHHLEQGDSAYFNAEIPHCVQNSGKSDARLLCVFLERP